jgi:hypothetical protein
VFFFVWALFRVHLGLIEGLVYVLYDVSWGLFTVYMRNKRKTGKSREAGKQEKAEKQRSWKSRKAGKSGEAKRQGKAEKQRNWEPEIQKKTLKRRKKTRTNPPLVTGI